MNDGFENNYTGLEAAVIGMTGRFPKSADIREFWKNLASGNECITFFTDEDLREAEISEELLKNPKFIRAYGWLEGIDLFDAVFFGYTPLEAELMDPQIRIFHECVLEALENAGYDPFSYNKMIGLYAGASANFYWQARLEMKGKNAILGAFTSKQFNDKDFMCTRIAYKLNLKGPAVIVDTACSTSLVAVHMAYQGLIAGDCDMALAGGVSVGLLEKSGYIYQEGMLRSPDGHCRAFDAEAKGTNFGNAAGVVVLKRLDDAAADGDTIYAVIRGSSINNDGERKSAFTAPSIEGQAGAIRTAQKMAEVEPETIGYIETHGTGTPLGDPVEIEGLKAAFNTPKKHFCRIGSVKTNVGHLESAAGVAGFIKTVLALKNRIIPPSLFFERYNPRIDFENSPFIVNKELFEWKRDNGRPLRAGVSSFGIGGTNAHVVLEEWREDPGRTAQDAEGKSPGYQLVLLSAKTETALEKMTRNLADHLEYNLLNPGDPMNHGSNLADVAYTLQVGRRVYKQRRMLVCAGLEEAVTLLSDPGSHSGRVITHCSREDNRPIVFMFPGQGSQYVNMGRDLYEEEPLFRDRMDRCFKLLGPLMEENLKEILYPSPADSGSDTDYKSYSEKLNLPGIAPVVIFIFEYALAGLLLSWGIKPHAMIGYSFGEYTAACVSGVFTLEDALKLVVFRGKLIRKMPAGAMLSVPLSMKDLTPLLLSNPGISAAIDNGPSCVVSGSVDAVGSFEAQMKQKKLMCMKVPVPHALHSSAMEAVSREFEAFLSTLPLNKREIPYISNVTGDWITEEEAVDPVYWSQHLRRTVRFADGMRELLKEPGSIFLEVGPGRDISTLTLRHIETHGSDNHQVLNMVRHPHKTVSDVHHLLDRIGKLWLYGHPVDWDAVHSGDRGKRKRIPLPAYPFERQSYWFVEKRWDTDPGAYSQLLPAERSQSRATGFSDWFYLPAWTQSVLLPPTGNNAPHPGNCLVFLDDDCGLASRLVKHLEQEGNHVIAVTPGNRFEKRGPFSFAINPAETSDYYRLFKELGSLDVPPSRIVHLWGVTVPGRDTGAGEEQAGPERFYREQETGFHSLVNIAKAIDRENLNPAFRITVITDRLQEVTGDEPLSPGKATVIGALKVIPQEYPNIRCRGIDVTLPEPGSPQEERLATQLAGEISSDSDHSLIAYRGNFRWVRTFNPLHLDETLENSIPSGLKEKGVYLVTGGLGDIGLILAGFLAEKVKARLVLVGRSPFPPRSQWDRWPSEHGPEDPVTGKITRIRAMENAGAEVLVAGADAGDKEQMRAVLDRAEQAFGPIDGVIHAAGVMTGGSFTSLRDMEKKHYLEQSRAKVEGLFVLEDLLRGKEPGFFWLMSSISTVLGGLGMAAYAAVNSFMDAFIKTRVRFGRSRWISVDWDGKELTETRSGFHRILSVPDLHQAVFSSGGNLQDRLDRWVELQSPSGPEEISSLRPRPALPDPYMPPRNEIEQTLANTWQTLFGFEKVGILDDFIELGGDSLKGITMINRVHRELGVPVPLGGFFKEPTIRWLAEYIAGAEKNTRDSIPPVEKKEYYPVSFIQKRIFILTEMNSESTAYNNIFALIVEGNLDKKRLEGALAALTRRHESLRTSFDLIDDESVQIVHDEVDFKIRYIEREGGEEPGRGEIEKRIGEFVKPFNLRKAPLMRMTLMTLDREKYLMLFDMHHMITDGVSFSVLTGDFVALYEKKSLPPLTLQYKDFSQWQYGGKGKEEIEKQEEYWLRRFEDGVPVLDLRTDFPRPAIQVFEGEHIVFLLEGALKESLLRLVKETETTLYIVLLAVCNVLLFKYTGQEDIVVGSPVAARAHVELENLVGMFINALVLRNHPRDGISFSAFLSEVKESTLTAFENQDYPFGMLIEKIDRRKDLGRNPLYDFELIVQNIEESVLKTAELRFQPYSFEVKTAQVDITLEVREVRDGMVFKFIYCTALFKRETMEQFIRHFEEVMAAVTENPGILLEDIRLPLDLTTAGAAVLKEDETSDFGF